MTNIRRVVFKDSRGADPKDIKLIVAGLLLACGAAVSLKVPIGGAVLCDHGQCQQTHYASFGTITDSFQHQAAAMSDFRVEIDPADGNRSRVTYTVLGETHSLTAGYGFDSRDIQRLASDGNRFLEADREERLTLRYEERSLTQLLALLLMLGGAAISGWLLHQRRSESA